MTHLKQNNMEKITGNEPINSIEAYVDPKEGIGSNNSHGFIKGLTIRPYFAAMAMQGLLSNGMSTNEGIKPPYCKSPSELASEAVTYADALIKELNKGKP